MQLLKYLNSTVVVLTWLTWIFMNSKFRCAVLWYPINFDLRVLYTASFNYKLNIFLRLISISLDFPFIEHILYKMYFYFHNYFKQRSYRNTLIHLIDIEVRIIGEIKNKMLILSEKHCGSNGGSRSHASTFKCLRLYICNTILLHFTYSPKNFEIFFSLDFGFLFFS